MTTTLEETPTRPCSLAAPRGRGRRSAVALFLAVGLVGGMLTPRASRAQNLTAAGLAPSLKRVPVPQPTNLEQFVKNKGAAIALGKALFWDMQVGSDGVQACASCHFHAGADNRFKNVVSPGLNGGDTTFQSVGPNGALSQDKFPFTQFLDPNDQTTALIRDWNDVVSSPGVYNTTYVGQPPSGAVEQGSPVPDPVFNVKGINTRRVEPRNAPTAINAVFNFANFWDGRANFLFNGSSPFGDADPNAGIWVNDGAGLSKARVRVDNGSLASQAVGPPGSPFEMSFAGRGFPDIGKKLLNPKLVPLGGQNVHPGDSVLGPSAKSTIDKRGRVTLVPGLKTTYAAMVQAAFQDRYWNDGGSVTLSQGTYRQMEANFSLFFGLAVQLYEATLVSDDSPYDRFQDCAPPQQAGEKDTRASCDPLALSPSAQEGLNIFLTANEANSVGGNCINCHGTSTFSNASIMHVGATNLGASLPEGLIERMPMGDAGGAWYDSGFYDIGVRPIAEDGGRGGKDPFNNPLSHTERSLRLFNCKADPNCDPTTLFSFDPTLPTSVLTLPCGPDDPFGRVCPDDQRVATRGAFKTPTLRNVELTGPYMHNGGEASLMQVLDFYARGGNFFALNIATVDADIQVLCGLNPHPDPVFCPPIDPTTAEANQSKVIDFLLSLTDDRVRWERAPFDHPELFIPNGAKVGANKATDIMLKIPAVGAGGLAAEGLPPIGTFLNLPPH